MHVLLSFCLATGLLLIFLALTGRDGERRQPGRTDRLASLLQRVAVDGIGARELLGASLVSAFLTAAATQALLGWPVLSVAAGLVGSLLPAWYFRRRAQRRRLEVEESVADAVDALREATRIGLGIEEGVRTLARTGPRPLRRVFREVERDIRLAGFEEALQRGRERVADPTFDMLAAALLTSYRVGGRQLGSVLDGLSRSVRARVRTRREVHAMQAQNVLSARVIAALPLGLIVTIRATNPDYLAVFGSVSGQAVLALCLVSVALGYAGMLRASAVRDAGRVLR